MQPFPLHPARQLTIVNLLLRTVAAIYIILEPT